jgi:hypothetical protein
MDKSAAVIRREERHIRALERISVALEIMNRSPKIIEHEMHLGPPETTFFQMELRGTVSDAGGGEIILTLDRNTHVYPPIGKEVVMLYQMRQQERVYQLKQQG